ncbi:MAG: hypothetical protein LBU00_06110 [Treponema sp.]|nr:hypothetical protein [Treponema sp.]
MLVPSIAASNLPEFWDWLNSVTQEIANEYMEPLPDWVVVERVKDTAKVRAYNEFIDLGESSAIALALEADDALLIIDDLEARRFAETLGLKITGTVGILLRAYKLKTNYTDFSFMILLIRKNLCNPWTWFKVYSLIP